MPPIDDAEAIRTVAAAALPLHGEPSDFDALLALTARARVVLIGEASHGTHDFYRVRAELTKRLIREQGFRAVAVEADWPDAYRINRYVRGRSGDHDAEEALEGFQRFPRWMWRNADVLDFVGWLKEHNAASDESAQVGFYGLDLYSLHASIAAVIDYLQIVDPGAAARAARRYGCFDHAGSEPQSYGYAATLGLVPTCEREVITQLVELRAAAGEYALRDGRLAPDDLFFAERNAQVVTAAEAYYRTMFRSHAASWNTRDRHMSETLVALERYHLSRGAQPRIVVWAHNSHLGDARGTDMPARGELNLGQLTRERLGQEAVLVGFTTWGGTVTAAPDWDAPAERMTVRPALPGSYESLFHETGIGNFYLDLHGPSAAARTLMEPRLERAIGVIYRPDTERLSHYLEARLPAQFDAVLHYDRTRAIEPLERTALWTRGQVEVPDTFPSAL